MDTYAPPQVPVPGAAPAAPPRRRRMAAVGGAPGMPGALPAPAIGDPSASIPGPPTTPAVPPAPAGPGGMVGRVLDVAHAAKQAAGSLTPPPESRIRPMGALPPGTFGPGHDLRFSQIDPTTSVRQDASATAVDAAAQHVADFDPNKATDSNITRFNTQLATPDVGFKGVDPSVAYRGVSTEVGAGPSVNPTDSTELAKARGYQMNAADAIATGPSRQKIARDTLDAFDLEHQNDVGDAQREVGQRAASLGRIGMGETALEALRPFTDLQAKRASLSKDLAAETAAGDISDRRNNLSDFQSLTQSTAGLDASKRGELRTERSNVQDISADNIARAMAERDAQTSLAERNTGRAMDERNAGVANAQTNASRSAAAKSAALNAGLDATSLDASNRRSTLSSLSDLESGIDARSRLNRGETRGERQYQTDTAKQATEDAIRQHLIEQQDKNTELDRQLAILRASTGGDTGATTAAARQAGGTAADDYEAMRKLLASGRYTGI